jgi:pimeloyl-ACP methyl ester carboxylesterase
MDTPEPRLTHSVDVSAWSPPLPEASGFDHLVVETPGLHTHLATIGEGEPVVLLHGFPQHWWQWHAIAPVIAAGGYRVICPDLRGAGWTVADDPRVERETRLGDLLALFDVLHIERAHLVAHDMGVITAWQLTYDHPERVRTAVQLSVPPGFMKFSPKLLPGFRHLPRSSGTARAPHCAESSPRGTSPTRYRRQPSKPTSPRCADPTSTPRCVRSTAAWSCPKPCA